MAPRTLSLRIAASPESCFRAHGLSARGGAHSAVPDRHCRATSRQDSIRRSPGPDAPRVRAIRREQRCSSRLRTRARLRREVLARGWRRHSRPSRRSAHRHPPDTIRAAAGRADRATVDRGRRLRRHRPGDGNACHPNTVCRTCPRPRRPFRPHPHTCHHTSQQRAQRTRRQRTGMRRNRRNPASSCLTSR